MKLLFSRRHHPGSYLIRAVTWGTWSHTDILLPDNRLIAAAAPSGVDYYSFGERIALASKAAIMTIPLPDELAAERWGETQIGKRYDWTGVIGLGVHREWDSEDAWWCSEFALAYMKAGLFEPFRHKYMRRVTPEHEWMLNFPVEVVK